MAAALAHAEQTQAASRARENEAPFDPGFDPGYEVPALDSPTTMMSEPEQAEEAAAADAAAKAYSQPDAGVDESAEIDESAEAEAEAARESEDAHTSSPADADADAMADTEAVGLADSSQHEQPVEPAQPAEFVAPAATDEAEESSEALQSAEAETFAPASTLPADDVEPAPSEASAPATTPDVDVETPLTTPPTPWPTLNHSAFDDEPLRQPPSTPSTPSPAPSPAAHSSLDPAAAFAPKSPSGLPPYGAYSAKASWPPLRPGDTPTANPASEAIAPEMPDAADDGEADHTVLASEAPVLPDAEAAQASHEPAAEPLSISEPFPKNEEVPSASGFLRTADPADPEAEAWAAQAKDVIEHDLGVTPRDGTPDAVARETTTRHWLRQDDAAAPSGPVFAPDFLRHTREREQARTPRAQVSVPGSKRTWMRAVAVVLGLGILIQGVYLARSQIAGSLPVLRPVLEAACAPFGCDVPPWRDLDALRIDSSQLQKQDEGTDVYQLAVTLRNQGRATTALPAIELVMTDLQDQLLLRRVLQPTEYLEPAQRGFVATGLRAGSELPVRVRFRTQQSAANYRVLIFYP